MKNPTLKWMLLAVLVFSLLESCANDDDINLITDTEQVLETSDTTTQLIIDWNDLWLEIDRYAFGMRPTSTSRALAYIHLAAYETAVDDMVSFTSNNGRLQGFNIDENQRPDEMDMRIALNRCYARVMDHFMYNVSNGLEASIGELEDEKEDELSEGLSDQLVQNSRQWGNYVAQRVIAYSQTDTEAEQQILDPQPLSYEPPVGDGFWTYSAPEERAWFPYWESVRTFAISSSETSSIPPPIHYSETVNSAYYNQMNEVYVANDTAKEDDNEELWIAEFWSDDVEGLMLSPPGRQFSIAGQLVNQFDLDYESTLTLFLKLGFSLNDAAVSSWADKYEYMVMRPNVYINEFIDPDFQTNLYRLVFWPNPSFPGYPSGHSTFASAAAGIFIDTFGDSVDFTDRTHEGRTEFRGAPRQFSSFSDMAEENAFSRIPLGVHIRMDCTEGYRLGYEVADAVNGLNLASN
ncbi:vanadium-dependent haloperoxidase [Psychroserpens algicola]|uniref:Vanadium-dependent haloperoxidase n=1 Tax=Psychroserpens algicola TaxID=1719034 RepID=A0ABT0H5K1_9FLAO|nr:vanadium-dependent haloperoxidase [Psychroserpens algicola]MCK8479660.1 vanadium-dependent haloperoxidase [Psychroserpens algicola]